MSKLQFEVLSQLFQGLSLRSKSIFPLEDVFSLAVFLHLYYLPHRIGDEFRSKFPRPVLVGSHMPQLLGIFTSLNVGDCSTNKRGEKLINSGQNMCPTHLLETF